MSLSALWDTGFLVLAGQYSSSYTPEHCGVKAGAYFSPLWNGAVRRLPMLENLDLAAQASPPTPIQIVQNCVKSNPGFPLSRSSSLAISDAEVLQV